MNGVDLATLGRILLAVPFVLAGMMHLVQRRQYVLAVLEYRVLPVHIARFFARVSPLFELAAGVAVLVPATSQLAAAVLLCLITAFALAVSVNLARGRKFACSCFGGLTSETIGYGTLIRLFALAGCAVLLLSARIPLAAHSTADEVGTAFVAIFIVVFGYLSINRSAIVSLFAPGRARRSPDTREVLDMPRLQGE